MITIFPKDEYEHYFPTQAELQSILREIDRLSPIESFGENYNHRDIRASSRALLKIFGINDETELQKHLQPYSDGIVRDVNKNIDLMRNLYLGIGEGFFIMDRLDLYELQGASTLYGVYEYFAKRGLPPPFGIGHSQAGKFRQIYWAGYRLQLSGRIDDEERHRIFEVFKDFDNKDKIYHAATFMTPQNYQSWIDFATDDNVTLDRVISVARGGRKLLGQVGNRNKLTPQFIIAASEQVESFELPKTLYITNVNDAAGVVQKLTGATTRGHIVEIRDGLTEWLKKN